MPYRLRPFALDDKMCQEVSLDVFEQIYPHEPIAEQLSLHHAWEEREGVLNMVTVIKECFCPRIVRTTSSMCQVSPQSLPEELALTAGRNHFMLK